MSHARSRLPALLLLALAAGCSGGTGPLTEEMQLQIQEMDAQMTDMQEQLTAAQSRAGALSAAVTNLEASVGELERRVLDLGSGDLNLTRPEVEAAVSVVRQRTGEVRDASSGVVQSLVTD